MQNRYLYLLRLILAFSDFILINLAFAVSFYAVDYLHTDLSADYYQRLLLNINLLWLLSSNIFRLYNKKTIRDLTKIYRATWKSVLLHLIFLMFYLVSSKDFLISRTFLSVLYSVIGISFLTSRFCCTIIEPVFTQKYKTRKPVAVMGMNETGQRLASYFRNHQKQYRFEGFLNEESSLFVDSKGNLLPGTSAQIKKAAETGIKEVYVSLNAGQMGEAGSLLQEAERQCVRLKFVPDFTQSLAKPYTINFIENFPVISLRNEPLEDVDNRFKKRLFDIIFSSLVILFILSWLFPLLAVIIKLQSPGPVLFKQMRNGRNNEIFWCYKFRSMKVNADSDSRQASKDDSRITPIGRFMRRTSLDELPQFFNVLYGNMSIAGPRPHMLKHTEQYRAIIDKYMVRHYLKPGITGWAQVNGFRGETSTKELMEKRVEHDIWYLENWSMMLDIKIIFLTIINAVTGEEYAY